MYRCCKRILQGYWPQSIEPEVQCEGQVSDVHGCSVVDGVAGVQRARQQAVVLNAAIVRKVW